MDEKKVQLTDQELFSFVEFDRRKSEDTGYSDYSYWRSVLRSFAKNKFAVTLLVIMVLLVVFAFFANATARFGIEDLNRNDKLVSPNATFWFGTDSIGRDMWARTWYATTISLEIASIVTFVCVIIGIVIGCIWGYVRRLDRFFTEVYNIINNVPTIIYMTLIALLVGQSFTVMAVSLIAFGWLTMARNVRNLVIMYRDREYNLASRCLGTLIWRILVKNLLPYLISVIILRLALSIPSTIALESTLSYLGLGLDVNTPSLGILLRNARTSFLNYPYLLIFPAVIVSLITVTFYLIGNAFSDAADPRNHV